MLKAVSQRIILEVVGAVRRCETSLRESPSHSPRANWTLWLSGADSIACRGRAMTARGDSVLQPTGTRVRAFRDYDADDAATAGLGRCNDRVDRSRQARADGCRRARSGKRQHPLPRRCLQKKVIEQKVWPLFRL